MCTRKFYNYFMISRKDGRLTIAPIGEFYEDLLKVDALINARTIAAQANSLLCAKLMQRQQEVSDRVVYLAKKKGISSEELWTQILNGTAQRKTLAEDIEEMHEDSQPTNE